MGSEGVTRVGGKDEEEGSRRRKRRSRDGGVGGVYRDGAATTNDQEPGVTMTTLCALHTHLNTQPAGRVKSKGEEEGRMREDLGRKGRVR